ncbi:MAG: hypothetical protein RIC12_00370 [Pirellulales bacterium]
MSSNYELPLRVRLADHCDRVMAVVMVAFITPLLCILLGPIVLGMFLMVALKWLWENVTDIIAIDLDERRRRRRPLPQREPAPGTIERHFWTGAAMNSVAQQPFNQRLLAEAPGTIRAALKNGLVVRAQHGFDFKSTRFIEWISEDDKRVIAYWDTEKGVQRDVFRLRDFCLYRDECKPLEAFLPTNKSVIVGELRE